MGRRKAAASRQAGAMKQKNWWGGGVAGTPAATLLNSAPRCYSVARQKGCWPACRCQQAGRAGPIQKGKGRSLYPLTAADSSSPEPARTACCAPTRRRRQQARCVGRAGQPRGGGGWARLGAGPGLEVGLRGQACGWSRGGVGSQGRGADELAEFIIIHAVNLGIAAAAAGGGGRARGARGGRLVSAR